ncbi:MULTISPECIES: class I SAM-dependent methyltransferase [unclassified Streptomyces]|uniref:class I SAM-dependent methyltransferase n=1 Tax=unclassified Streptomyces TaxID=2593676 RepID=UPI001F040257|nr:MULTISPECIES: class I SAM-dependent methyltransferase [unclassified Streptomyces]MCH0567118.1 class I SAM-dependent methyltransferase [Streptomyces sp. MUM 2J]MCH0572676.1 class I SAM-dependent methyltransferase [Streptomyces sp. MUM 136J]
MWDGRADAYAGSFALLCAHPVPALLDAADVGAGTRVLDVGTGTGTAAVAALERGARVRAVDADAGMVAAARARGVDTQQAVLPELPHRESEFDAVVGNFALNHVGRPRAALAELRRVLRPGGRVAVTVWGGGQSGMELLGRACEAAGAVTPAHLPRLAPEEDFPRTTDGLAELLAGAGFTDTGCAEPVWEHRATPEEWWTGAAAGIGTIGRIVTSQTPVTIARIRRAYDSLAGDITDGDGRLRLQHRALLASGTA